MGEILRAENVCKYFGGVKAVNGVSMSVNEGEIVSIIGPNGAGKTTFFNICSGYGKATKGKVYFNGEDITAMKPETISAKGLARTFQKTQLFKYMSVFENVKIGCHKDTKTGLWDAILHTKRYKQDEEYAAKRSAEIIKMAGLEEYSDTLAGNLAYGIQRRVEIARALASSPKILLLDEPAAGMNPNETQELMYFIKELNAKGQTIVLIEHDMKFVMNCSHRIVVLNFGQKICEGVPDEVKNNAEVQRAYFGSGMMAKEALG